MSIADIKKGIKSVVNRGQSLQRDVQLLALSTLSHVREHGDWTVAVELTTGIGSVKSQRYSTLKQYMETFMVGVFETDDDGKTVFLFDKGHDAKGILVEAAEATNWFDFRKDPVDKSKTLAELVELFAKQSKSSVKTGKIEELHRSMALNYLAELVAQIETTDQDDGEAEAEAA